MGCGDADIGEEADVSGDVGLCGGGEDGLGGGEAKWFFLYFSRDVFLVSLKRGSG